MEQLKKLNELRTFGQGRQTLGLPDNVINDFLATDKTLGQAIDVACDLHHKFRKNYGELLALDEAALINKLQEGYVNFYPLDQRNPYVTLAARGPWIVTTHGAVIHDSGGYGMLGLGHAPETVMQALAGEHVMANIMTANLSQHRLYESLNREIGHSRSSKKVYSKFICMNSGSEAVTVAARLSDIHAKKQTDPNGPHAGKRVMFLSLAGGFHGRTERPAQASSSTLKNYAVLATFRGLSNVKFVQPNDCDGLKEAFAWAKKENVFFECMLMEPVMGEGDPGKAITPEFYNLARQLTKEQGTLLLIDSIQAGFRAQGSLSLCDYPGFETVEPPDMETYSKALNAGQFPLSILAMSEAVAKTYITGVYGNTMTANPRALEAAVAVLDSFTPELRRNIRDRGAEFVKKLTALGQELPGIITKVQGTGLLCSAEIDPTRFKVVGKDQLEEKLRKIGIGVIHGGANALRFTPHFNIASREIDLIIASMRQVFKAQ